MLGSGIATVTGVIRLNEPSLSGVLRLMKDKKEPDNWILREGLFKGP